MTEARNAQGDEYGVNRLMEAITAHREETAHAIGEPILRDLRRFTLQSRQADDVPLVLLKVGPTAGGAAP